MSEQIIGDVNEQFEEIIKQNFDVPFGIDQMVEIEIGPENNTGTNAPDTFSGGVVDDEADVSGD